MIAGRLDYCNAVVLIGFSTSSIDKLQRVQITLARVVSRRSRFDHATPLLADLHWLPVRYRIEYKLALITFKALTRQEPQYLAELIRMYEAPRQLRPCGANILQCSPATLNFSRNAFCHIGPAVWNKVSETVTSDITVSIATFKSRLKTRDHFDPCSGSESEADSPKSNRSRSNGNRKPI